MVLRDAPDSRFVSFRLRGFSGHHVDIEAPTGGGVDRTRNRQTAHVTLPGATYRIERQGRRRVHDLFDAEGRTIARFDNSGRMRNARLVLADGRWYRAARRSSWGYTYEVFDGDGRPVVHAKGRSLRTDMWSRPDFWALPHPLALLALLHEAIDHVRTYEGSMAVMAGVIAASAGAGAAGG